MLNNLGPLHYVAAVFARSLHLIFVLQHHAFRSIQPEFAQAALQQGFYYLPLYCSSFKPLPAGLLRDHTCNAWGFTVLDTDLWLLRQSLAKFPSGTHHIELALVKRQQTFETNQFGGQYLFPLTFNTCAHYSHQR